jgi:superfamily II DNA helicase RecQ
MEERYLNALQNLSVPNFQNIRSLAIEELDEVSEQEKDALWRGLDRGKALLDSHLLLCQYLYSYGRMHEAKLVDALSRISSAFWDEEFEIVDWGCGQGIASLKVFDVLREINKTENVKSVTLIEPAVDALNRARHHVLAAKPTECAVHTANKYFHEIEAPELVSSMSRPRLHLFSNILDVDAIDLKNLASLIDSSSENKDILLAVSPIYSSSHRVEAFLNYFNPSRIRLLFSHSSIQFKGREWTYLARVWSLDPSFTQHIKDIKNFPPVLYAGGYVSDLYFDEESLQAIREHGLQNFTVSARYDLGAQVYNNIDPFLTVLHNITVRGVPTRLSPLIEKHLSRLLGLSQEVSNSSEIRYDWMDASINALNLVEYLKQENENPTDEISLEKIQSIYTPLCIGRFHKVLIEALLSDRLSLQMTSWKILVEEKDVPFAALAIEDFKEMFESLSQLLDKSNSYKLPTIELTIINTSQFQDSPLHLGNTITTDLQSISGEWYDLAVCQSCLEDRNLDKFRNLAIRNDAQYNIGKTKAKDVSRYVYTTDLLSYQPLIIKDENEQTVLDENACGNLEYFLRLLFRKQTFRPGQIPILNRALQNLPVIGLLPTGGGKSLTYQLAALLQPGLTMIIDPLKSLMKDQYEGLIHNGIDAATYINSSLSSEEKKKNELLMESSRVLFTFLSPERIGIATFRERLENMYDRDAFFAYGVIDEVHCVSEWGHDFRFNYLHLGRNLYQHVKGRNGPISLLGLTATASFDVLADVERELSGHGAFDLDTDTVVRFENTNRLELQYKIEKVPVQFEEDIYFDKDGRLDPRLPKAVRADKPYDAFNSKKVYLPKYIQKVPHLLEELLSPDTQRTINRSFMERQNLENQVEQNLSLDIKNDYWKPSDHYSQAAIVFCPHVATTGVSVRINHHSLKKEGVKDVALYSGKDDDVSADVNLRKFRNDKSPVMVATKAFGMGIDKPNVRYTVNLNYSSSLEAFIQEAGRAGRDQKMALSTILFSDYEIAMLKRDYSERAFPVSILRNKWFKKNDLQRILNHYNLDSNEENFVIATPTSDIVKLYCRKNHKMFAFRECDKTCSEFEHCKLKDADDASRGWQKEKDLVQELARNGIFLSKKDFQYLSPDYQANMFFYSSSFKGDFVEKTYMNVLLNLADVRFENDPLTKKGFLDHLLGMAPGTRVFAYISYTPDEDVPKEKEHDLNINRQSDLSKAIYRLTTIGLIDDFTQDYVKKEFRIGLIRKGQGDYYRSLETFLTRYFTEQRAKVQIEEVKKVDLPGDEKHPIKKEVFQCIRFLTQFIYDKISIKRKRAIDDIRTFCLIGLNNPNWLEANEEMKDFVYYYFNSKYARSGHLASNNEPFCLVEDTQEGQFSSFEIVEKYLRVIDDQDPAVGNETPLDNVKHLHGAIRLISRSLTDSNPAISLLEAFCLAYLNPRQNENLITQLEDKYIEGMTEFHERLNAKPEFWVMFEKYNQVLLRVYDSERIRSVIDSMQLIIHYNRFKKIKTTYLSKDDRKQDT